jgi:transporter family protein
MNHLWLPLAVASMMGFAAIIEKLSLKEANPLAVFTIRSIIMLTLLLVISFVTGQYRDYTTYSTRTYIWILIPALLAVCFLWMYFTALQGDLVSRVFPIVATAPVFTLVFSVLFLGEPFTLKRLLGIILIILGIVFVK